MAQTTYDKTRGIFPVTGERSRKGAIEAVAGRILWAVAQPEDDERRTVSVKIYADGNLPIFSCGNLDLDRGFVRALGEYDRGAQAKLIKKVDWEEAGFDIRLSDDRRVHSTSGSIIFTGERCDKGSSEEVQGSVAWSAWESRKGAGMRRVNACVAIFDDDGPLPSGEIELDRSFVGRLAEEERKARKEFVGMMNWAAKGFDIHPVHPY